jgi:hypothetical protein
MLKHDEIEIVIGNDDFSAYFCETTQHIEQFSDLFAMHHDDKISLLGPCLDINLVVYERLDLPRKRKEKDIFN